MSSKARRILLVMHLPDREPLASVVRCIHLATGHSHSRLRCLQVLPVLEELVKCSPLVFIGSIPQSHQIRMSCCSRTADDAIQEIPLLLVSFGRRQLTSSAFAGSPVLGRAAGAAAGTGGGGVAKACEGPATSPPGACAACPISLSISASKSRLRLRLF